MRNGASLAKVRSSSGFVHQIPDHHRASDGIKESAVVAPIKLMDAEAGAPRHGPSVIKGARSFVLNTM